MLIHMKPRRLRRRRIWASRKNGQLQTYPRGSTTLRIGSNEARTLEIEYGYAGRLAVRDYNRNPMAHIG